MRKIIRRAGVVGLASAAALAMGASASAAEVEARGFLKMDIWTGLSTSDNSLDNTLLFDEDWPDNPDITSYTAGFTSRPVYPDDSNDGYGARISGWITPTQSGQYRFFLYSDDSSRLYLSTDDNPDNIVYLAEEFECCNPFTEPEEGTTRTSEPVSLVAGNRYYIEAQYKEGGGGDYLHVAWRREGDTTPAASLQPIAPGFLSSRVDDTGASVTITAPPQNLTISANSTATFTVEAQATTPFQRYPGGQLEPAYLWYRNGEYDPSARGSTYSIPLVTEADNNTTVHVVVAVPGATNMSAQATLTVTPDTVAPTVEAASGDGRFRTVILTFSEPLNEASAETAGNYTITPNLAVSSAELRDLSTVILTTAQQTPGTSYTVAISGVQDLSGNAVAAGTSISFSSWILGPGALQLEYFGGLSTSDNSIDNTLLVDERFPDNPDEVFTMSSFNTRTVFPTDAREGYGARIWGLLTPTESGDYRFFISSDDSSRLFISEDDSRDNLQMIAEEPACCNAFTEPDLGTTRTSEPVSLVAGRQYYLEGIFKEGGGGDYMQVAWRREGDDTPAASLPTIPGRFFTAPIPPEGVLSPLVPTPDSTDASPNLVRVEHLDGLTPWTAENVSLRVDGASVTPTINKEGGLITIEYVPNPIWSPGSTHNAAVTYPGADGPETLEWSFTVAPYTVDNVGSYIGVLKGASSHTEDRGGVSGDEGDYGMDFGTGVGVVQVMDATFFNPAVEDDTLSIAYFQKLHQVQNASAFWALSPSSSGTSRGFQAHTPWGDQTIYFDTAGCCTTDTQRINLNIVDYPEYTGDASWWQEWHHFAFVKDGSEKRIYINGELFHSGLGDPLPTDFSSLILGGGPGLTDNRMAGVLDEFTVWNAALSDAQVAALASGTAPGEITGNPGLIAHWDFNDPPTGGGGGDEPTLAVERDGANLRITYTGTLEASDSITGSWQTVEGSSPATIPTTGSARFFRARN